MLLLCPGSIPEWDMDKLYNTWTVFSPTGTMLGKYRKVSIDVVCVVLFLPSFFFGCYLNCEDLHAVFVLLCAVQLLI